MYEVTERLRDNLSRKRLGVRHFRVWTGEQLKVEEVQFMASKNVLVLPGVSLLSINIVATEKDEARPHDIDRIFEIGFKLAKRKNRVPLLRGMQFGYVVIPMVIGRRPDEEALLYAASAQTMPRFCLFRFPIVIDVDVYRVIFFEGFELRGGVILAPVQKIVTRDIEPVVDQFKHG